MRFQFPVLLICLFVIPAYAASSLPPESYTEKVETLPDLTQKLERFGFKVEDSYYCAPVAVSNGLIWLSKNGYPNLARGYKDSENQQAHYAVILGGKQYMNTRRDRGGTSVVDIMRGLYKYVLECGYIPVSFRYQGWRTHPKVFSTQVRTPDLNWIKSGIVGSSLECLNVGFYKYDPGTKIYKRTGGHWVSLAGYGVDKNGAKDPSVLLIHDPASRDGLKKRTDYVKIAPIKEGYLQSRYGNPFAAKGFHRIVSGLKITGERIGIIDGAVVMRMK